MRVHFAVIGEMLVVSWQWSFSAGVSTSVLDFPGGIDSACDLARGTLDPLVWPVLELGSSMGFVYFMLWYMACLCMIWF